MARYRETTESTRFTDAFAYLQTACALVLGVALFSPLLALPPFDTGYYNLVAGSIAWTHACAGIGAVLIAIGCVLYPKETLHRAANPVTLFVTGFAILSLLSAFAAEFPWLAIYGAPQLGKSALWYFDGAIFISLGWIIAGRPQLRKLVIMVAALVAAAIAGILAYVHAAGAQLLLRGGDSYAYLGMVLPFLSYLAPQSDCRWLIRTLWAVGAILVLLSTNSSATLLFFGLAAIYLVLRQIPSIPARLAKIPPTPIVLGVVVIALSFTAALLLFDARNTFDSIDSRLLIAKITAAAIAEGDPMEWLIGYGWGHTQLGLYRHLPDVGVSLIDNRWDFLWRDIFHSHNLTLELIYETGVLGLLALMGLLAGLFIAAPESRKAAAGIFVLGYLAINGIWFEYIHWLPLLSLVILSFFWDREPIRREGLSYRGSAVVFVVLGIGLLYAAGSLHAFDRQVKTFKASRGALFQPTYPTAQFPADPRDTDFIRASVYREALRLLEQHRPPTAVTPAAAVKEILNDVSRRLHLTQSPDLLLVGLVVFNEAYYRPERAWMRQVVDGRETLWRNLALRHFTLAPKRTDVLVFYLSWMAAQKSYDRVLELTSRILKSNAIDPVALYFKGVVLVNSSGPETKAEGLETIARSLEAGIERYFQVPDWLKSTAAAAASKRKYKQ